jgi:hypothetical protein
MKQKRKRVKRTKVSNQNDAPLSTRDFHKWVDRVLAKPINPKGIIKGKKTNWVKRKDLNPK